MTPKEKAKELVEKFEKQNFDFTSEEGFGRIERLCNAKQCALICVGEILELQLELSNDSNVNNISDFYKEVKQEIEKL